MTAYQRNVVGDRPVFDLNATANGQRVKELGGDVTVTVPYQIKDGENPSDIRVYYVNDDGALFERQTTYDPATGTITFVTDHFSYYVIGTTAMAPAEEPDGDDTVMYIAAVVVAVIVIAAVVIYYKRHAA